MPHTLTEHLLLLLLLIAVHTRLWQSAVHIHSQLAEHTLQRWLAVCMLPSCLAVNRLWQVVGTLWQQAVCTLWQ